jgi:ribosome maturation factor RimP
MAQRQRGATSARPAEARSAEALADEARFSEDRTGARRLGVIRARLRALVEPVVVEAGLELEDLSVVRAGRRHVVRVTVDGEDGVGHDELTEISHRLSLALDAAEAAGEDLLDSYTLEVSSPGVDRLLTLPRHWRRNSGRLVTVRADERTLTARIAEVTDAGVAFVEPGPAGPVPFERLGPGRVQVEFTRLAGLADEDFGAEFTDDTGEGDDGDARSEMEDRA